MSTLFRFAQLYALRGPKRGHGGHDTLAKINFLIRAACMPDKELGSGERHQATRGGEHIVIRRAEPQDKALYSDFLRDVSAEDLRLRFFARVGELSAAEGERLSHLDYRHEMAFIALDEKTSEMLGLVRLRDELDEETAEFAILVRSRLKGHGLGWLLMQRVIDYAKEKGLRRVYGDVLAENASMLQMTAELGFHTEDIGSGLRRIVLNLNSGER
jgi:GNAT superfamily N-acetyltransferase